MTPDPSIHFHPPFIPPVWDERVPSNCLQNKVYCIIIYLISFYPTLSYISSLFLLSDSHTHTLTHTGRDKRMDGYQGHIQGANR